MTKLTLLSLNMELAPNMAGIGSDVRLSATIPGAWTVVANAPASRDNNDCGDPQDENEDHNTVSITTYLCLITFSHVLPTIIVLPYEMVPSIALFFAR